MRFRFRHALFACVGAAWVAAVLFGTARIWRYQGEAGVAANAPLTWPADSKITRASLPTLLVVLHPRCPCSNATVDELARMLAHCDGKLETTVVMVRPPGAPVDWETTGLGQSAAAIPGVTMIVDKDGEEARRFGAVTSGQTLLYGTDGRLQFAGGITQSRGHSGDNAGTTAILSLISKGSSRTDAARTPVFGCALFDGPTGPSKEGCEACRQK